MKSVLVVAAAALLVLAAGVCAEQAMHAEMEEVNYDYPIRTSDRQIDGLRAEVADRAALLLRSLDADHDKLISVDDARAAPHALERFLPGLSVADFASFVQLSDKDGDQKLSQHELNEGLAAGLQEVPEFLELAELAHTGGPSALGRLGDLFKTGAKTALNGAIAGAKTFANAALGVYNGQAPTNTQPLVQQQQQAAQQSAAQPQQQSTIMNQIAQRVLGRVDTSQDSCVLCQYVVERCETNVKQAGVIPSVSAGQTPTSFLEEKVEVRAQDPFDAVGSAVIGAARQSTRVQRQLERQKYNEIYRVVDITLDDVCEQGMPNAFYGYCKQIYQVQSDLVDGLRYQYRPADICFRVGMCGPTSYITRGVHSRYK